MGQEPSYRDADVIRKMIVDENTLINYRVTWLSVFNGLLFTTYGSLMSSRAPHAGAVITMLGIVGIIISGLCLAVLVGAQTAIRELYEWHDKEYGPPKESPYKGPPVVGLKLRTASKRPGASDHLFEWMKWNAKRLPYYLVAYVILPIFLVVAWVVVLKFNHSLGLWDHASVIERYVLFGLVFFGILWRIVKASNDGRKAARLENPLTRKAYIITGPTSGIGRYAALELAKHGTVVLVGRDCQKLDAMQRIIQGRGQQAVAVVCDLSDPVSVGAAAAEIIKLPLSIVGLLNNADIMPMRAAKNALGWDMTFATNYLGPFALTEALIRYLPDGANVVFVCSGVEDPESKPAEMAGFRGGRYVSVEASTRGEWASGGSTMPGVDAYATSKQCILAAAIVFARETPRLRINALEQGFTPNTGLRRLANAFQRFYWNNPKRAARVFAEVLINESGQTGIYYDKDGNQIFGSTLVRDPEFQNKVVEQTRKLLSTLSK